MEKQIKDRYNEDIFRAIVRRYDINPGQIRLLDGFESFIYEFQQNGAAYILRIGHSARRSASLIRGEIDWLNYLAGGGVSVARAVPSARGELVECVEDGRDGFFLATAFVKARGVPPWEAVWDTDAYERYGRILGQMHTLTKDYEPSVLDWRRPEWDAPGNLDIARWLPETDTIVLEKFRELKRHLDALPKNRNSYGLIHQDAHGGNLFVDEAGNITLFDFDDCVYSWFIYDIAVVLFYQVMYKDDPVVFAKVFMRHFMRGYYQHNRLDDAWLAEIPYFLKLREIDLYALIHRSFDINNLDAWCSHYMDNRKEKIENDLPYIDFDFSSLR